MSLTLLPNLLPLGAAPLNDFDQRRARALAGAVSLQIGPRTQLAIGLAREATGLLRTGQPRASGDFLIADRADAMHLVGLNAATGAAVSTRVGADGTVLFGMDSGEVSDRVRRFDPVARFADRTRDRYRRITAGYAVDRGAASVMVRASWLDEDRTVLGARFNGPLAGNGAQTLFADARIGWQPGAGWTLAADWREGWSSARSGGIVTDGPAIRTRAWSVEAVRDGALLAGDRLALRIAQPLRVSTGGLRLNAPISYDYSTLSATFGAVDFNLAPTGQERVVETVWTVPLAFDGGWTGALTLNGYWRVQPNHIAAADDDVGAAIRFVMGF